MKNKKGYIFLIILGILVIVSILFTITSKEKKNKKLNTNVNVTVNVNNNDMYNTSETSTEDSSEVTQPGLEIAEVVYNEDFLSGVNNDNNDNNDTQSIEQTSENLEDIPNNDTGSTVEISSVVNQDNFLETFTNLLSMDLNDVSVELLPVTNKLYNECNGIIYEDTYNNGFIVLKAGLNTENNTFVVVVRTVNSRAYIEGTLENGKVDTVNVVKLG